MAYSAAAWSRPIGSDAVGLDCTWGLPHSDTGDWFSVCDVILAGSWVRKQGCTPEIVLIRGDFPCLLLVFSFAVKSSVSDLPTIYREVWKEIQTGLYFTQHQSGKSIRQKTSVKCG